MRYFYNSWDSAYKSHFGAIARNQSCQFTIRLPEETPLDFSPVLVVFRTGFKERFLPMNVKEHENGYVTYTTDLIPKYSGVHYYYFSYTSNGVRHYIKRGDACHGTLDQGEMFQLTVYSEDYQTPQFLKGGVMYQIFPDRFCSSGKMHDNVPSDRVMREWGELPYYKPDQNGHVWNNDYFGGDLDGIRSKLDYLKDLGVTCIYLNPIFESHENHRYNTANYRKVDPLLGTNEDFRELCKAAKTYGISVILDGVFSHTGADSIYFNKFGRYPTPGAYQSERAPITPGITSGATRSMSRGGALTPSPTWTRTTPAIPSTSAAMTAYWTTGSVWGLPDTVWTPPTNCRTNFWTTCVPASRSLTRKRSSSARSGKTLPTRRRMVSNGGICWATSWTA